jgi:hypothetical protein
MAEDSWSIPKELRPDPADYGFDLHAALGAVVSVKSRVPADAFSARTLGTEREGSGVVIREADPDHRLPGRGSGQHLDHHRRRARGAGPCAGL